MFLLYISRNLLNNDTLRVYIYLTVIIIQINYYKYIQTIDYLLNSSKRKSNLESWENNKCKKAHNLGQACVSTTQRGNTVAAREVDPGCCQCQRRRDALLSLMLDIGRLVINQLCATRKAAESHCTGVLTNQDTIRRICHVNSTNKSVYVY